MNDVIRLHFTGTAYNGLSHRHRSQILQLLLNRGPSPDRDRGSVARPQGQVFGGIKGKGFHIDVCDIALYKPYVFAVDLFLCHLVPLLAWEILRFYAYIICSLFGCVLNVGLDIYRIFFVLVVLEFLQHPPDTLLVRKVS